MHQAAMHVSYHRCCEKADQLWLVGGRTVVLTTAS